MDNYYEQTVDRLPGKHDGLKEVAAWLLATAAAGLTFYVTIILLREESGITTWWPIFLIACVMYYMLAALYAKRLKAEYEYVFTGDEMEVARILSKGSRKSLTKMNFGQLIAFGKYKKEVSQKHKPYNTYSAYATPDATLWYGVYIDNGRKKMVIFEPDEKMLELIKHALPRELRIVAFEL